MYKSWVSWFDYVQYTLQECLVEDKYVDKQKEINQVLTNMSVMKRRVDKINISVCRTIVILEIIVIFGIFGKIIIF